MAEGSSGRDLDAWLARFLVALGRKTRRHWAPLYLRDLLGPGDRKSLQPMAARLGLPGHDHLQHFIASPTWDDAPLWSELARTADRLVGGSDACLVIDDTGLPKTGLHRHALMTCIACAYLQHLRLAEPDQTGRGGKGGWLAGSAAIPEPARRAAGHQRTVVRGPRPARARPALPTPLQPTI